MIDKIKYFNDYLKAEKNFSKNTLKSYSTDIEQFIKTMNINNSVDITKESIRNFLASIVTTNSSKTRARKLASIKSFCKFLVSEGYLSTNPSAEIKSPKIEQRLPKVIDKGTVSKMLNSISNIRDKAILETLYGLGVRASELVNIKITDIDFNNKLVKIFGKGSKERIVPINDSALKNIAQYIAYKNEKSVYVFPSATDKTKPITTKTVQNIVSKYARLNNINNNISPHTFRHSYATHLLENGADIRIIQKLLGHENINTTTIYTDVAIEHLSNQYHLAHPRG